MASLTEEQARQKHPELFLQDSQVDRRQCQRVVPLEVLCPGLSRTGTASLQAALQILGYDPCYHGYYIFSNIKDTEMWEEALNAKYFPEKTSAKPYGRAEFDQLLGHVRAVTDFPAHCFVPELLAAYPAAKVVLVERDIDTWYKSIREAYATIFNPTIERIAWFDGDFMWPMHLVVIAYIRGFFRSGSQAELAANLRPVYREHYAMVREVTPKERLLDFRLADGWAPLCEFLGKEVPKDTPFPRINEASMLREKIEIISKRSFSKMARKLGLGVVGAVAAVGVAIYMYRS